MKAAPKFFGIMALALAVALAWTVPASAKKQDPNEKKAARLWFTIQSHLNKGRDLEACRLVQKMAPYENTEAYQKAKKTLLRKGISIRTPLISWTSQAIVRAQNLVERDLISTGDLKNIGVLPKNKDAWGTPLRVEMAVIEDYLYLVRSAGPDRKYMTDDDILIGGLKPKGYRKKTGGKSGAGGHGGTGAGGGSGSGKKAKSNATREGLMKQPGARPQDGGGQAQGTSSPQMETGKETHHQEEVVELDDLLEKTD